MRWGPKFDAFVLNSAKAEFLEGTTASGKTTVGLYKFILEVATSDKKHHIISALDKGVIEKNLINKDHGIEEEWGSVVTYYGNGRGSESLPHMVVRAPSGEKIIYCLGYADKARWKKALGGQYGCLYIDEINVADIEFVREASMRSDYIMATLNPDDPALPVYEEYINRSRPVGNWSAQTPNELIAMLDQPEVQGWCHWYFNMDDNIALTEEKKDLIKQNVPEGTKLWKNKIMGLRGRATGLVFSNFTKDHIISAKELKAKKVKFKRFAMGVDTSYSQQSPDTIAMIFIGITDKCECYVLEERIYNNALRHEPLAPSDVIREIVAFADVCRIAWGDFRYIFIDSADQATITEAAKFKRQNGSIYAFESAWKKMPILDRINLQLGWFAKMEFYVLEHCKEYIRELGVYSWQDEKDLPEDGNDHTINACQYAWLPYVGEIGTNKE